MHRKAAILLFLGVCGCGGLGVPNTPVVTNGIVPGEAELQEGRTQQFILVRNGVTLTNTFWSCDGGSIDQNGKYKAPSTAGSYTVTGTDGNFTSSASVLVN